MHHTSVRNIVSLALLLLAIGTARTQVCAPAIADTALYGDFRGVSDAPVVGQPTAPADDTFAIGNALADSLSADVHVLAAVMDPARHPLEIPANDFSVKPPFPDSTVTLSLPDNYIPFTAHGTVPSIYSLPYSLTGRAKDWHRMWINTAVLSGAFVGTLFVLECLPEDATSWNRAEIRQTPMFERWYQNVFVKGPEWDHDKFYFNYLLHPYAGAVYFMSARSCGFNFWQSLLYSSIISDVGWEFGIEAFMERPSYQDMFITPLVGSVIGEGFYRLKRHIVDNDYRLFGSPIVGNVVAFLIDPVNEVVGFFDHNPARAVAREKRAERGESLSFAPMISKDFGGFTLVATF